MKSFETENINEELIERIKASVHENDSESLAEIFEECGLPPGVVNVVTATGPDVDCLLEHPGVAKILVAGSISVVRQLLAAGLLDELRLLVHPVAARHGERLFDEGGVPDMGAGSAPHAATIGADRLVRREIAGGAGRAGQYHAV